MTHCFCALAFLPEAGIFSRKCHSISLFDGDSVEGPLSYTGRGTACLCEAFDECHSEIQMIQLSTASYCSKKYDCVVDGNISSLLKNLMCHVLPFLHSK
jgi:hypothetical protein